LRVVDDVCGVVGDDVEEDFYFFVVCCVDQCFYVGVCV